MKAWDHQGDRLGLIGSANSSRGIVSMLILALLMVNLWIMWAGGAQEAAAASPQVPVAGPTGPRRFYLTKDWYAGDSALTACTSGYHMASLWEVLDVSNLEYNVDLGQYWPAGDGAPPTDLEGWVRTGYASDNSTTPGQANCNAWTGNTGHGTVVELNEVWQSSEGNVHVWNADIVYCYSPTYVWCVED